MSKKHNNKQAVEQRREEAKVRQEAYDKLTTQQKIERLDRELGVGVGAVKQRAKLAKLVEA